MAQKGFLAASPGRTYYGLSFHPDGRVLDAVNKIWTAFVLANLANYVLTATEIGGANTTGIYTFDYPSGFVLDVLPTEIFYQQTGPAPSLPVDAQAVSIGQSQGSNVAAIDSVVLAAQNLSASAQSMEKSDVIAGSNTVIQAVTELTGATDNLYRGRVVIFYSGTAVKAAGIITGYTASTHILQFTALALAPVPGDLLVVV